VAIDRAAALLKQLAGGEVAPGIVEAYPGNQPPSPIHVRPKRVEDILGLPVSRGEMTATLKALGATVGTAPRSALMVTPPSYRTDVRREIDVIEEIARIIGYGRVPATLPSVPLEEGRLPPRLAWEREVKRLLTAYGFFEVVALSFAATRANAMFPGVGTSGRAVAVANPINRDEPEMRRSLLGGLLGVWRTNRNQGARGVAAFTIGRVFWHDGGVREGWRLGGLLAGDLPQHGLGAARPAAFADAKGALEAVFERTHLLEQVRWIPAATAPFHPGKTAIVCCGDEEIGIAGALHPDREAEIGIEGPLWVFELDIEKLLPYRPSQRFFTGLPRYPAVMRDLAVVVDEDFASDRVVQFVRQWRPELVEDVALFDAYTGAPIPAGKKSLAYAITYRAADRTLTDEVVNALQEELLPALTGALGVELRQ